MKLTPMQRITFLAISLLIFLSAGVYLLKGAYKGSLPLDNNEQQVAELEPAPAKDICRCKCLENSQYKTEMCATKPEQDKECSDFNYDYGEVPDDISKEDCEAKTGQQCTGYLTGDRDGNWKEVTGTLKCAVTAVAG